MGGGSARWPTQWCYSRHGPLLFLGTGLSVMLVAVGSAAGGVVAEELYRKASSLGSVRVIVQLRVDARSEGELNSPEAVASQRQAIATAQALILRELAGTSYRVVRTYETIPFLALDVSLGALQALDESALVMGVEEDRLASPQRTPNHPGADVERAPADENSCILR